MENFPLAVDFVVNVGHAERSFLSFAGFVLPGEVLNAACHPHLAVRYHLELDDFALDVGGIAEEVVFMSSNRGGPFELQPRETS